MTALLSISQPNETEQVICGAYQHASDLVSHYNSLYSKSNKDMPRLPEWALHAIFEHFANTKTLAESMASRKAFLCQFMITHRGAALDCFFDNILAADSKTGQYLIYRPDLKCYKAI